MSTSALVLEVAMPVVNYQNGEINIKIVYYGPGMSGKTTNLEYIYSKMPRENKGKMVSMKTRVDRTLFFDFLPIDIGKINGMNVRFLLYTVPGQVYYNATRKLVLKGVDAVVFVADSSADRMADNKESLKNLEENLNDLGMGLDELPWIIQYNKRDLPDRLDIEVLERELNSRGVPSFEAIATMGKGVYETFEAIAKMVFSSLQSELKESPVEKKERTEVRQEKVDFEVVAKGKGTEINSETGDESVLENAEKSEEEHESVSEFVDSVLSETPVSEQPVDMGADREGYEDYGHLVELDEKSASADEEETEVDSEKEDSMEIISDPLEKLTTTGSEKPTEKSEVALKVESKTEKVIRVPIKLSKEDLEEKVSVKLVLEIEAD